MKNQTAVQFIIQEIVNYLPNIDGLDVIVIKALTMEKSQIENAVDGFPIENRHLNGDEYYKKTFKA
jgi:hypothetical protein